MPIRTLPALLVNQIAAGEVIERPASVVKELVDNAIDAGASCIDVFIEEGGCERIEVRDDGGGVPMDELPLAVAPHATSKLQTAEDLNAIATMGFRGEALASIASVSRLQIISRTAKQSGAAAIEAEGEHIGPVKPTGGPIGTTVIVRNLFFNTPARRKFLRTPTTEASRISETIESLALSHPAIAFRLQSGRRTTIDLPGPVSPKQRVLDILGRELAEELLEVATDDPGLAIWGMIGRPDVARATANHMRLYLNGRPIRDRSLHHALKEAYRGLIEPGRFPTLALLLELDPSQVDVNVHPTKSEVRFRNQTSVHGAVLNAVRRTLRAADLTPALSIQPARPWTGPLPQIELPPFSRTARADDTSAGAAGNADAATHGEGTQHGPPSDRFVDYFRRLDPTQKGFIYREVRQALAEESPEAVRTADAEAGGGDRAVEPASLPMVKNAAEILQVHSSYLVTQDETGIVIIDQHALHERVMFEQLKARIGQGNLEAQRLLMPAVVEVGRAGVDRLDEMQPLFERIGIEADQMGPGSIAIHAFPSFLFDRGVEPEPFVFDLFERAAGAGLGDDPEEALFEVLDMMACKAAVKAGDRLTSEELRSLLEAREQIERASNCPHGRPTSLRLSLKDLDRQFGRS